MTGAQTKTAMEKLARVWRGSPEARAGKAIIEFLATHLDSKYIPVTLFFEVARPTGVTDVNVVLNIVNYFTGADLPLLNLRLEYIDDEDVYMLEPDEIRPATDKKINPLTGLYDPDLNKKLFVCYSISDSAQGILGGRQ